jgi:negative regulator of sigma E activity
MSEQIREQVSAFLDGELPGTETELLLKRLTRDGELRESFGRYALIGEALRGASCGVLTQRFASRVNLAIDGEPTPAGGTSKPDRAPRWWRPLAGVAAAAGVAAVAIATFQQRAAGPAAMAGAPGHAIGTPALLSAANHEDLSYTVPAAPPGRATLAPARLTNYVFAHSKYSSGLVQRGVLADLLIEDDAPQSVPAEAHAAP